MVLFRRMKKTNAEVKLPFIGDTFAASVRRKTSLYTGTSGFCMQVSLASGIAFNNHYAKFIIRLRSFGFVVDADQRGGCLVHGDGLERHAQACAVEEQGEGGGQKLSIEQ